MLTGPEGRMRAIVRAASASVGNGSASFFSPQAAVGNLRVSQTECPPGYETRITNNAELDGMHRRPARRVHAIVDAGREFVLGRQPVIDRSNDAAAAGT